MTKTTKNQPFENKQQVAAFRKAARDAGCDDNEDRFQDALRAVAKHKIREDGDPQTKAKPRKEGR